MKIIFTVILSSPESPTNGDTISDRDGHSIGVVLDVEPRGEGRWSVLCEADVTDPSEKLTLVDENSGNEYSISTKENT